MFQRKVMGQAFLKLGIYGSTGSGKTFTSLLCAEKLAASMGKRVAVIDTEHGSDWYSVAVPQRTVHPGEFDFDCLDTRSLTKALDAVSTLDTSAYGVLIVDTITNMWDVAIAAYEGKRSQSGSIPVGAWDAIKRPYRRLVAYCMNLPVHLFLVGRETNDLRRDEETGEMEVIGKKMRAEPETIYEPHVLVRMEHVKPTKTRQGGHVAYVEKDRSGILSGMSIMNPTYETLVEPLMKALGGQQAVIPTLDEVGIEDAERLSQQEYSREKESNELMARFQLEFKTARDKKALLSAGKKLTPEIKTKMLPKHVVKLQETYREMQEILS